MIVPAVEPAFTVAFVRVQVPNMARGTRPLDVDGASAIHSALAFLHVVAEQVWVVEKLFAPHCGVGHLERVPGAAPDHGRGDLGTRLTVVPMNWMLLLGNISHHVA